MRAGTYTLLVGCLLLLVLGAVRAAAPAASAVPARAASLPRAGEIVSRVKTNEKVVALTFDDGPDPRYTPAVLAFAREKGVRFTFFVVGRQAQRHPDLLRQEIAEGHAVGNHTWDHRPLLGEDRTVDAREIGRCDTLLQRALGAPTPLFRPPAGQWDYAAWRTARKLGYGIVLWSASVGEHSPQQPQAMAQRILSQRLSGAIILAHDGDPTGKRLDRTPSLQAVGLIVDELLRRGYRFVTVQELLAMREAPKAAVVAEAR